FTLVPVALLKSRFRSRPLLNGRWSGGTLGSQRRTDSMRRQARFTPLDKTYRPGITCKIRTSGINGKFSKKGADTAGSPFCQFAHGDLNAEVAGRASTRKFGNWAWENGPRLVFF